MRLLIILLTLTSCSIQQKVHDKRASNKMAWLERNGHLKEQSDTVWKTDTIKGWQYDTTVVFDTLSLMDTLVMVDGKDSVVTIIKWKERTVTQRKTQTDTVIRYATIKNTKTISVPCDWPWWNRLWIGAALMTLIFVALLWGLKTVVSFKPDKNTF